MEAQKTQIALAERIMPKAFNTWSQIILQSYSHKARMVLGQDRHMGQWERNQRPRYNPA